jgi:hypothetical protein
MNTRIRLPPPPLIKKHGALRPIADGRIADTTYNIPPLPGLTLRQFYPGAPARIWNYGDHNFFPAGSEICVRT